MSKRIGKSRTVPVESITGHLTQSIEGITQRPIIATSSTYLGGALTNKKKNGGAVVSRKMYAAMKSSKMIH